MIVSPTTLISSSSSFFIPVSAGLIEKLDNSIRLDLQRFSDSLFLWVWVSAIIVLVGVALEGPELLHEMWPNTFSIFSSRWVKKIGLIGWLLVVLGVAGEGIFEVVEYRAEGLLQTFNDILLADAQRSAGSARDSAEAASFAASNANDESGKATASASNAIALASGARREADTFAKDIVSAKEQAADAESHLADARKQAAAALEQLRRIKSPRALIEFDQLVSKLSAFKGTKYTLGVFQDDESIQFAKAINRTLHDAGWDRIPTPGKLGAPQLLIPDLDTKDGIPVCFNTGVHVHLRMNESLYMLNALKYKPQVVRTAAALESALASAIVPPDDGNVGKQLDLDDEKAEGEQPMNICIGRKP